MRIGTRIQKGWTEASQATGLPLAHQGNRQTDPDWPDRDRANARRRLVDL
jgi:hypothetical protein